MGRYYIKENKEYLGINDSHKKDHKERYYLAYISICWALVIMLVDIRIDGYSIIVPDLIGFIIMYMALGVLEEQRSNFKHAKYFAFVLIFISVFDIYQSPGWEIIAYQQNMWKLLIDQLYLFVNIFLIYYIFRAILGLAEERSLASLSKYGKTVWWLYFVSSAAGLVVVPLISLLLIDLLWLYYITIGLFFVSVMLFVYFVYWAGLEINSRPDTSQPFDSRAGVKGDQV